MLYINKQLNGKTETQVNAENFPRLFDGAQRVRDISIIETPDGVDIQTILNAGEILAEICAFLRRKYQAK